MTHRSKTTITNLINANEDHVDNMIMQPWLVFLMTKLVFLPSLVPLSLMGVTIKTATSKTWRLAVEGLSYGFSQTLRPDQDWDG